MTRFHIWGQALNKVMGITHAKPECRYWVDVNKKMNQSHRVNVLQLKHDTQLTTDQVHQMVILNKKEAERRW